MRAFWLFFLNKNRKLKMKSTTLTAVSVLFLVLAYVNSSTIYVNNLSNMNGCFLWNNT